MIWIPMLDLMTEYSVKASKMPEITQVYAVSKQYGIIRSEDYWNAVSAEKRVDTQIYSDDVSNYRVIKPGMFAYNPSRLNVGSIGCCHQDEPGLLSPMYKIFEIDTSRILPRYFELYVTSDYVINKIDGMKEVGARFRFDFSQWKRILIPVPSMEAQREIVEIADKLYAHHYGLKSGLVGEVMRHRQQYAYFRDMLLDFEEKRG